MAIKYCDFKNGNDSTGDGTNTNPFKTITRACQGLYGGDEVRVAKSGGIKYITGTITFTKNSYNITSSDDIFLNEISSGENDGNVRLGDFILGNDNNWHEVILVNDSKNAKILHRSGVSGNMVARKLLVTDTGKALTESYNVQKIEWGGDSPNNRLKISGGWDLATETQTGFTYFRQLDPDNFGNRYGIGLYSEDNLHIQIERLGFLRYNIGIEFMVCFGFVLNNCYGYSNRMYGAEFFICSDNKIYSSNFSGNGVEPSDDDGFGIALIGTSISLIKDTECSNNYGHTGAGIAILYSSSQTKIINPKCNYNDNAGILSGGSIENVIINYQESSNKGIVVIPVLGNERPAIKVQKYKISGDNRNYFENGMSKRDTTGAMSGECLKYSPTSSDIYIAHSFFVKAKKSTSQTLSLYVKKDSSFDGDVKAGVYFLGEMITDWEDFTPTADYEYEKKEISINGSSITEDGVIELVVKVRGENGNIYVDNLEVN